MTVTKDQLREYLSPILQRRVRPFHTLDVGLLEPAKKDLLEFAAVVGHPKTNVQAIKAAAAARVNGHDLKITQAVACFDESGMDFQSAGRNLVKLLETRGIWIGQERRPMILLGSETYGNVVIRRIICDRVPPSGSLRFAHTLNKEDGAAEVTLYLNLISSGAIDTLGKFIRTKADITDEGEFMYYVLTHAPADKVEHALKRLEEKGRFGADIIIHLMTMRMAFERFENILEDCDTPHDVLLAATMQQLESVLMHEQTHVIQARMGMFQKLTIGEIETMAHLSQSIHSHPDTGYYDLQGHLENLSDAFPEFAESLEERGLEAILADPENMRQIAQEELDEYLRFRGYPAGPLLDQDTVDGLRKIGTIRPAEVALLIETSFNPAWMEEVGSTRQLKKFLGEEGA